MMMMMMVVVVMARDCLTRRRNYGGMESDEFTQDGSVNSFGLPASRKGSGGWKAARYILAEQVMANIAFFAIATNLVMYLTSAMHESNAAAAKSVSTWNGMCSSTAVIAAFVADAYCGRFWGAVISSAIFAMGLGMLTVATSVEDLRPSQCNGLDCPRTSKGRSAFLYAGLYLMSLGVGGVQATSMSFGGDQFDQEDSEESEQKTSFFNWLYQAIQIGLLIASTLCVYIETNVSWGLGWGIAFASQILATGFLLMGRSVYRYQSPGGNPLTRIIQVVVAAVRKRRLRVVSHHHLWEVSEHEKQSASKSSRLIRIRHSSRFSFLDKAAIVTQDDKDGGRLHSANPWYLCTVTHVEEVKFLLRVLPVFSTVVMYTTCYMQILTLFVEMGKTMDRTMGNFRIPPASLTLIECVSVLLWVALYDRVLVPTLRRRTRNPRGISLLLRIGIGLGLSVLAMAIAAAVEFQRLRVVRQKGLEDAFEVPMSVFWTIPQYFVMGMSEVCTYIGIMEFFYDEAPYPVRSIGSSLSMLTTALGSFLSSLLLSLVNGITSRDGRPGWIGVNFNRGRADLFFSLLCALGSLNLVAFICCACKYEYMVTRKLGTEHEHVEESNPARGRSDDLEA